MQYKKLGEICDIICGQDYKSVLDENGKYPIYGTGGVMGYANSFRCPENTVIIGRKGSINNPLFVEEKFWNVDTAFGVVPNIELVVPKYFYYFCKDYDFTKHDVSVTIPSLRRTDIVKIPVPVPPLAAQSRIVSELDLLTSLIDNQKKQLDELSKLQQSTFYSMFGDPVENEKEWPVKKLGECVTEVRYGTSKSSCPNGQYKYLRMNNITYDGNLDLRDLKTIDIPDDEIEKCIVRKGDILFNRTNSMDLIGKTCMFDLEEPMVIAGYIIRVRLTDVILPLYVSKLLNTTEYKRIFKSMAKGAVNQANINAKELQSILIPLPPLPLQTAFAEKISAIEEMKKKLKASIAETQKMFDARMQEIFG